MKIVTENNKNNFVLDKINKVYIGFDDNVEVRLDLITSYDMDLDKADQSVLEFESCLINAELVNHFKGNKQNKIIYVRIEGTGTTIDAVNRDIDVTYDISCDMVIRRLRTNGDIGDCSKMLVVLEGWVK